MGDRARKPHGLLGLSFLAVICLGGCSASPAGEPLDRSENERLFAGAAIVSDGSSAADSSSASDLSSAAMPIARVDISSSPADVATATITVYPLGPTGVAPVETRTGANGRDGISRQDEVTGHEPTAEDLDQRDSMLGHLGAEDSSSVDEACANPMLALGLRHREYQDSESAFGVRQRGIWVLTQVVDYRFERGYGSRIVETGVSRTSEGDYARGRTSSWYFTPYLSCLVVDTRRSTLAEQDRFSSIGLMAPSIVAITPSSGSQPPVVEYREFLRAHLSGLLQGAQAVTQLETGLGGNARDSEFLWRLHEDARASLGRTRFFRDGSDRVIVSLAYRNQRSGVARNVAMAWVFVPSSGSEQNHRASSRRPAPVVTRQPVVADVFPEIPHVPALPASRGPERPCLLFAPRNGEAEEPICAEFRDYESRWAHTMRAGIAAVTANLRRVYENCLSSSADGCLDRRVDAEAYRARYQRCLQSCPSTSAAGPSMLHRYWECVDSCSGTLRATLNGLVRRANTAP